LKKRKEKAKKNPTAKLMKEEKKARKFEKTEFLHLKKAFYKK